MKPARSITSSPPFLCSMRQRRAMAASSVWLAGTGSLCCGRFCRKSNFSGTSGCGRLSPGNYIQAVLHVCLATDVFVIFSFGPCRFLFSPGGIDMCARSFSSAGVRPCRTSCLWLYLSSEVLFICSPGKFEQTQVTGHRVAALRRTLTSGHFLGIFWRGSL